MILKRILELSAPEQLIDATPVNQNIVVNEQKIDNTSDQDTLWELYNRFNLKYNELLESAGKRPTVDGRVRDLRGSLQQLKMMTMILEKICHLSALKQPIAQQGGDNLQSNLDKENNSEKSSILNSWYTGLKRKSPDLNDENTSLSKETKLIQREEKLTHFRQ